MLRKYSMNEVIRPLKFFLFTKTGEKFLDLENSDPRHQLIKLYDDLQLSFPDCGIHKFQKKYKEGNHSYEIIEEKNQNPIPKEPSIVLIPIFFPSGHFALFVVDCLSDSDNPRIYYIDSVGTTFDTRVEDNAELKSQFTKFKEKVLKSFDNKQMDIIDLSFYQQRDGVSCGLLTAGNAIDLVYAIMYLKDYAIANNLTTVPTVTKEYFLINDKEKEKQNLSEIFAIHQDPVFRTNELIGPEQMPKTVTKHFKKHENHVKSAMINDPRLKTNQNQLQGHESKDENLNQSNVNKIEQEIVAVEPLLIAALEEYVAFRAGEKQKTGRQYYTIFGQFSADIKIGAAKKIINYHRKMEGTQPFTNIELEALKDGALGKIISRCKNDDLPEEYRNVTNTKNLWDFRLIR